jgi:phosphoglycolate phosphatase-like HAD superfamily hydrolase
MTPRDSPGRAGPGWPARAALFDWDGTIVDSHTALLATWREVTHEVLGRVYPSTDAEVRTVLSRRGSDVFPTLSRGAGQARWLAARFDERYPHHAARGVRAFPGVVAALTRLRCHGILSASSGCALLVGDTPVDVATAGAAGIPAVGVTWGAASAAALAEAGASDVVNEPESLVQTVIRLLRVTEAEPTEAEPTERW